MDGRLVAANTEFGFNLLKELLGRKPVQNIFISPTSVAMALTMTYNDADGDTTRAMAKTLGLEGLSLEEVNRANADLKSVLDNPDPKVKLTMANSLWTGKGMAFKPEFLQRNKDYYAAEIKELDFSSPGAPGTINSWVSKKTNGKIGQIIKAIDADTALFLINAIYFKSSWTKSFDENKTVEGLFNLPDGRQKRHPMMSQSGDYGYYEGNNFQAISLPYGKERVSMYVFLPDKDSGIEEFHKGLNAENWEKWMSQFQKVKGRITLPRFKMEYDALLNDALKALGMEIAFNGERADFSSMSSTPLFIDYVKHKTFVLYGLQKWVFSKLQDLTLMRFQTTEFMIHLHWKKK